MEAGLLVNDICEDDNSNSAIQQSIEVLNNLYKVLIDCYKFIENLSDNIECNAFETYIIMQKIFPAWFDAYVFVKLFSVKGSPSLNCDYFNDFSKTLYNYGTELYSKSLTLENDVYSFNCGCNDTICFKQLNDISNKILIELTNFNKNMDQIFTNINNTLKKGERTDQYVNYYKNIEYSLKNILEQGSDLAKIDAGCSQQIQNLFNKLQKNILNIATLLNILYNYEHILVFINIDSQWISLISKYDIDDPLTQCYKTYSCACTTKSLTEMDRTIVNIWNDLLNSLYDGVIQYIS